MSRAGNRLDRSSLFRSRHRVGELVSGTVLGEEAPGLSWVRIDGQDLLAAMAGRTEPGTRLVFRVLGLEPEVLLQDLRASGTGPSGPELLQRFRISRDRFEEASGFQERTGSLPAGLGRLGRRRRDFDRFLAGDPPSFRLFSAAMADLDRLNAWLAGSGSGRAVYWPWLFPGTVRQEGLVRQALIRMGPGTTFEAGYSLERADWGGVRIRAFGSLRDLSYRVDLERPESLPPVESWLDRLARGLAGRPPRRLSARPLARGEPLAVLNAFLGPAPALTPDYSLRI